MIYPSDFIQQLKERAGHRCECERGDCHPTDGRCVETLVDEPGEGRWLPVRTGERITFPPVALDHIALCGRCAVPRTGRPAALTA